MLCSISKDDKNYSVYTKLYKHLTSKLNAIANDVDRSVNVENLMSDIYNDVVSKTGDHELGIRFSRMLPTAVLNITAKNSEIRQSLRGKGLDLNQLADLADITMNPEMGVEYVEKMLGTSTNLIQEVKDAVEASPKKKRGRKKKEKNDMPEGQISKDQLNLFNEEGEPIIVDVSKDLDEADIIYPDGEFQAVAPHALKDTDQEALSMNKGSRNFNIIDPAKKLFYSVKRAIVAMLDGRKGSEINYPGVGPVYLRAQHKDTLPQNEILDSTTPVVLVVVDQFGEPVLFDENAKVNSKGKMSFYNLRDPFRIDGIYEQERINAIANTQKIGYEQAKAQVLKERAVVEKIIKHITDNPLATIGMEIDGGTLGVIGEAPDYYFLSNVNLPTDAIKIERDEKNNYYFSLPSVSNDNIRLKQMTFAERPELIDLLTDLMVEDVFVGGTPLTNMNKKDILEKYIMLNPSFISMLQAGPRVEGNVLDISTPEAKAIAKQKIKEAFNKLYPMGAPISKSYANSLVAKGAKIVTSIEGASNGDILASKDLGSGEETYRVLRNLTLNITEKGQTDGTHFSLTPREEGGMAINTIKGGYVNNYIKDNFKIDKLLNANNEIVALNAYFTFVPLDSETSKLLDPNIEKEEEEEVDEFTKALLENKKKLKEKYDALPAEMKKAIEILNDAESSLPVSGITYSLHVSKVFENNLKKGLYTREEAEAILNYLSSNEIKEYVPSSQASKFNFKDKVLDIARQSVEKYTRPTKPDLSVGQPVSDTVVEVTDLPTKDSPSLRGTIETSEGKGHFSARVLPDGTSYIFDIQIGYDENAPRGKGYGFNAYIQIGKKLKELGYTLESTQWDKHTSAISPQALRVWEKLVEKGYAKITGQKQNKVYNRETGEEEVKTTNVYEFTQPSTSVKEGDIESKKEALRLEYENRIASINQEEVRKQRGISKTGHYALARAIDELKAEFKRQYERALAALERTSSATKAVEMKDPLDTTEPPPSAIEKKRRRTSRKADSSNNELKKDNPNDQFLGGRPESSEDEEVWETRIIEYSGGKITKADIDTARDWYNKLEFVNPKTGKKELMSNAFPFREAFDAVNQKNPAAIATWSWNGIILYKGSNYTQLYHEAFHGFVNSFLSDTERAALFDEVRNMTGTFKDFEGKMVPFKYATDKQVEEFLAEEFRQYMISSGRSKMLKAPARKSFFKKLLNILELLFGNLTLAEVLADANANSRVKTIFENLRKGDLSSYNFNKPDARFSEMNSTGVQALNEDDTFSNLNKKDTKILLDSMDGWIAQSIDAANSGVTTEEDLTKYLQLQVDMMMNRLSPAEMEKRKLEFAPKLTYSQTINFLKTRSGRTMAYKRVEFLLSELQLALDAEYRALRAEGVNDSKLQEIREKLGLVMFARQNFGDLTNIDNNKPDKDGTIRGVIALHLSKSKDFGTRAVEMLDKEEEEAYSRDSLGSKDGASVSQKELASAEVKYMFKTIFRVDPKTKMPKVNELGAPELMDENEVWNKVATILENELDVGNMYNKLVRFAQQEEPTEMTIAIAQLINKLGPRGLDVEEFPHLESRAVENLWTNFRNVFNLRRIGLVAQNVEQITDTNGKTTIKSTVGRGINPYAAVGKSWNSQFIWDRDEKITQFRSVDDAVGVTLNVQKVLDKYPNEAALKDKNGEWNVDKVFDFLDAVGIKMSRTKEVIEALQYGNTDLNIRGDFHIVSTLLSPNRERPVKDQINNDQYGNKLDPNKTYGYSLLEIIAKNGVIIRKPQDIFDSSKQKLVAGYTRSRLDLKEEPVYISGLEGEGSNWRELQQVEGQFGAGITSFMVTTADGNTKFEMSQNSTMSVMVSSVNSVEDDEESSAYQKLIDMPHMAKFDVEKNPNARRYVWLTNMFNIVDANGNLISKADKDWGKRKTATKSNRQVKLELWDVSGARAENQPGVSSAAADPFTKFVLDLHLAVQKGLPELMRHSDKSTSYSVILNYISSPGSELTGDVTQGQYVPNWRFAEGRDAFHQRAFDHYILPNLISEHNRVRRFMQKKKDIDATLKQIAKEKKKGQQITPTPVFDFNYLAEGQKFLTFQGILNSKTKAELAKVEGDLGTYFSDKSNDKAQKLLQDIVDQTKNYFEGQFNEVKDIYDQVGFVADNVLDIVAKQIREKIDGKAHINSVKNKSELENILLNSWVYNSWIHNVESMNFLYGDIALYNHMKEEFHKRNAGIASTGVGYRTDEDWLRFVNKKLGRKFEEQLTGKPARLYDGTMNTGVMKDKITRSVYLEEIGYNLYRQMVDEAIEINKRSTAKRSTTEIENAIKEKLFGKSHISKTIISEESIKGIQPDRGSVMSNYNKMTEADAQGWISMDSYRILMDSQGVWTPAQENMYQAMLKGEEIPFEKLNTFFPPIKAQYWGALANQSDNLLTDDVSIEAFHKFSLAPIVPSMTKNSPKLEQLHNKMMREGVDYVLFESGSKTGTLTSVQFDEAGMPIRMTEDGRAVKSTDKDYSEKLNIASIKDDIYTEERDINEDVPFTVNKIHVEFLKNQLNIEPKWKGKVTFATQIRKLIEVDLMENGIPTDFLVNEPIEDRIEKWFNLSPDAQLAASKNFRDLIDYEKAVYKLTQVKKAQLMKKAKLKFNDKGELIGDMNNLVSYVRSQLTNQDIADHELDFISVDDSGKLKHDLSFSLAADKIEKLLNALVVKSLIRQKVNGEALIQVASAMTEPQFRAPTEEELKQYGTNGLRYYTISEDGKSVTAMKIKIAMQGDFQRLLYLPDVAVFKDSTDDAENVLLRKGKPVQELDYDASLANLNRLLQDEAWLDKDNHRKMVSLHGDRIPVQGLNSDEAAEVYEFLPANTGNIIILPAEIVAKSGGDFDIDKLTLMMPNISLMTEEVDGELRYTVKLYESISEENYKERYKLYKEAYAKRYLTKDYDNKRDKEKALSMHFAAFGGKDKVYSEVIDLALEEGDLMTFEDFVLADQEKAVQNELLFSLNNLTTRIENYKNLVRPNGTDILDPIVESLKGVYRDYNPAISTNDEVNPAKGIQASKIFEITYNLYKHMTNNLGKKALGIGAIDNTYNELLNRIGMYLVPNNSEINDGKESEDMKEIIEHAKEFYKQEKIKDSKSGYVLNEKTGSTTWLDERTDEEKAAWKKADKNFPQKERDLFNNYERQTLMLPHNTLKVKGYKDRAISFSHRYDVTGENKISDVINQMMNGWVDIAKDPRIFYLRGNDKLGPLLLFLVQAGVPINHAAHFISQPIIVDYMNTVDELQGVYSSVKDIGYEEGEKITRDKAILRAKEMILEKLGIPVEGKSSQDRIKNMKQVIARESSLLDLEEGQFELSDLESQLKHAFSTYPKYDEKGRPTGIEIDYTDSTLADYQKSVFLHFLQIADMERALKDVKLRTNVDTGKSGTLYEAQDKIIKLIELKRGRTDDFKDKQTKYWRLPSDVIDRLIPTIKVDGQDTGQLDESKLTSPIASFYQQPFQVAIWKDLFPFRNNIIINKFLTDLTFLEKDRAKEKTYFKDDIELMSEFKSALLPILFQNTFLTIDVEKLKEGDEPVYYRDSLLMPTNRVEALPEWGAVYKDGIMYYDYDTLWYQFNNKEFLYESNTGVAPINNSNTFTTFGEYVKFVFEREYLRTAYFQDTFTDMNTFRKSNNEFNNIWKSTLSTFSKAPYLEEGQEVMRKEAKASYERDRLKFAFEIFLRNKALKNVYNMHAIFNDDTAYALDIINIKRKYGESLLNAFPVLKNLSADSEVTKGVETNRMNLAFLDSPKDKETIDSYYYQIQTLSNEVTLKKALPELSTDELYEIANTFRKLPIIAFLQSGMSAVGKFALTRVVDNTQVEAILLPEVSKLLDQITVEESGGSNKTLKSMFNAFVDANKRYDARGKNYLISTGKDGESSNLLSKKMFISTVENGKSFDPQFISSKGVIAKPYVKIGDLVDFSVTLNKKKTLYKDVEVNDIQWDGLEILVFVETEEGLHILSYSPKGELVRYRPPGEQDYISKLDRIIKNSTIKVSMDLLRELPEYNYTQSTQPGDNIFYTMRWKESDGKENIAVKQVRVVELEEIGYEWTRNANGTYEYISNSPRYRVKIEYDKTISKKVGKEIIEETVTRTVHDIVDSNGKIIGDIQANGNVKMRKSDNSYLINLRPDRVKANFIATNMVEAAKMANSGIIYPGAIVDIVGEISSTLIYLDASTLEFKPLPFDQQYTNEEDVSKQGFNIDSTNFFTVFNGAENPGDSVAQTRMSGVAAPKGSGIGNIDLRDRYIYHSDYQNKAGIITRMKYGGGTMFEHFTDNEDGTIKPEVKEMIDKGIDLIKKMRDEKELTPVFNQAGYGQYMIGADDATGQMLKDKNGNRVGEAVAPETFKYLSTRLLEEFGYINPNFVKEAEGTKEIIRVVEQPVTDEEYSDLMNKCFM